MLKFYSIRDGKSETYNKPFTEVSNGVALRNFMTAMENEDSMIKKYPEDFSLWQVGQFDETTGEIIPANPECIGKAVDLKGE
jgi:hypothetical protein